MLWSSVMILLAFLSCFLVFFYLLSVKVYLITLLLTNEWNPGEVWFVRVKIHVQSNLFNTDTEGTEQSVRIREVSVV